MRNWERAVDGAAIFAFLIMLCAPNTGTYILALVALGASVFTGGRRVASINREDDVDERRRLLLSWLVNSLGIAVCLSITVSLFVPSVTWRVLLLVLIPSAVIALPLRLHRRPNP